MPRAYLLAVAQTSALDSNSNNLSLFNLVEEVQVKTAGGILTPGTGVPYETHVYWELEPAALNRAFEMRLVAVQNGVEHLSDIIPLVSDKRRHRVRNKGTPLFFTGVSELKVEWRFTGDAVWTRESAYWPLDVSVVP